MKTQVAPQNSLEKTLHINQRQNFLNQDKGQRILLISEEQEIIESLQMKLTINGYRTVVIHDGLRSLHAAREVLPDLIIIDWSPSTLSGLDICQRLKTSGNAAPIILLTQENNSLHRISGFKAGAKDCISPPFCQEELFARIQSHLPVYSPSRQKSPILQCSDLRLNRNTREVFRGQRFISLTTTEFNFLEYMMEHYFQVLTRSQILEAVWGYEYMGISNIIEVYIRYLRRKLENENDVRLIYTVRSVGYILRESRESRLSQAG